MGGLIKEPFKIISSDRSLGTVIFEADYWEGPIEVGREGRYVRRRFTDKWVQKHTYWIRRLSQVYGPDRLLMSVGGHPENGADSCSYNDELRREFARIGIPT